MKYTIHILILLFAMATAVVGTQTNGVIKGTILDPVDSVIPNARITIQNDVFKTEVAVDDKGRFEAQVPPGTYRLTTNKVRGFAIYKRKIRVRPGQTISLAIVPKLVLAELDCVLTVTGRP